MNRAILLFVVITYALSIALAFAVGLTGGRESRLVGLGPVAMLFPAIAVLVVRFAMKEKIPSIGWSRFPLIRKTL